MDTRVAHGELWCPLVAEMCTTLKRQNLERISGGCIIWCTLDTIIMLTYRAIFIMFERVQLSLTFVPCVARLSINSQHYALDYITSLFNMHAPTCFGSRVPSSGSFLDPCELLEKQNNSVVCL
jgi:hypothetical protein